MHGVLFRSLRDYVGGAYGSDAAETVFAGEPAYLLSETYPDERLTGLVARAAEVTGRPYDELLEDFGAYTGRETFARLYPAFFEIAPSTRDFLLTVETRIHELVRATIPHAAPPRLRIAEAGDAAVEIRYESERRLCVLLRGLVAGTASRYGERAEIEETQCMLDGAEACVLRVRLSRS